MRISDWSSDVCSSDLASSIIDLHDGRKVANEWAGATPPTTQGDAFMATDQKTLVVHPGDIIQGTTKDSRGGHFFMVSQCKAWGVGAIQRWIDGTEDREAYYRFKIRPEPEFVVVGAAHLLPVEIAQARRDSIATTAAVAKDQG